MHKHNDMIQRRSDGYLEYAKITDDNFAGTNIINGSRIWQMDTYSEKQITRKFRQDGFIDRIWSRFRMLMVYVY